MSKRTHSRVHTRAASFVFAAIGMMCACGRTDPKPEQQDAVSIERFANAVYAVEFPRPAPDDAAAQKAWSAKRVEVVGALTRRFVDHAATGSAGAKLRTLTVDAFKHFHPDPGGQLGEPQVDAYHAKFVSWQDQVLTKYSSK